jgi:hypothetical protein
MELFFGKPYQVSGTGLRTLLAPELPELALNEENPTGWWWAGGSYPHSLQRTPNSDSSATHTSGISEKRPQEQTIEPVRAPKTLPDLPSLLARQPRKSARSPISQGAPDSRGVQVVFTDSLENLTSFCLGTDPLSTRPIHFKAPPAMEHLQRDENGKVSPLILRGEPTHSRHFSRLLVPFPAGRGPTDLVFFSVAPRPQVPSSRTLCGQNTRHGWGCCATHPLAILPLLHVVPTIYPKPENSSFRPRPFRGALETLPGVGNRSQNFASPRNL